MASVSPSNGSSAGGTIVAITGRGYPSLGLGLGDTLAVRLYGVPCTVLSSNHTTVVYRSGPAPSSPPAAYAAALKGQHPGMRGAEYELYRNSSAGNSRPTWWGVWGCPLVPGVAPLKSFACQLGRDVSDSKPGCCVWPATPIR